MAASARVKHVVMVTLSCRGGCLALFQCIRNWHWLELSLQHLQEALVKKILIDPLPSHAVLASKLEKTAEFSALRALARNDLN